MTDDVWTVKRILEWIEGYLLSHGDDKPRAAAQWLVAEALGVNRMQLFMDLERPLSLGERDILRDYTRRRAAGEPLQYISGKAAFRHIEVAVKPGVLIPRPETEVLVSEALKLLPDKPKVQSAESDLFARAYTIMSEEGIELEAALERLRNETSPALEQPALLVADMCTGSGCIACSVAYEHPQTHVVAVDISDVACALARENVAQLGLEDRVEVVEGDLGEAVDERLLGLFDLVVSNPPYIPTSVLQELPHEVSGFEPRLALDGGQDGLDLYRPLLDWARKALKAGGGFACELHETCLDDAAAEADYAGFEDVRVVDDLAGRPRVLVARKR